MMETLTTTLHNMMREDGGELLPYFKCYAATGRSKPREDAREVDCNDRPGGGFGTSWSYHFTLEDRARFEKVLLDNGIDPEWVELGRISVDSLPCQPPSNFCIDTQENYNGVPVRKQQIEIPNPKDVVEKASERMDGLLDEFDGKAVDVFFGLWEGPVEDLMDVLSVPVYMLTDAVAAMKAVKAMGTDIEKAKKKDLIMNILTGIMFLIPFLGGALGAAGRTGVQLARMFFAIELGGSAALGVYEMLEDPDSAPVAIVGMLLGAVGLRTPRRYGEMAAGRRKLQGAASGRMGDTWKSVDPQLQRILGNKCNK
jgi:chitinase